MQNNSSKKPEKSKSEVMVQNRHDDGLIKTSNLRVNLVLFGFIGLVCLVISALEHLPIPKAQQEPVVFWVVLLGGMVCVAAVCSLGILPLLMADHGQTKAAQALASLNAKISSIAFPVSTETAGLYLTLARVCRSNADYGLSEMSARHTLRIMRSYWKLVEEYAKKSKKPKIRSEQFARTVRFIEPETLLVNAWTQADLGRLEEADASAAESIVGMLAAITGEVIPQVEWDKSEPQTFQSRLNVNLTEKLAEKVSEGSTKATLKVMMPHNYALLSNAYQLRGLVAIHQGNIDLSRKHFRDAFNVIQQNKLEGKDSELNYRINKGCALMIEGDARAAKTESEMALAIGSKVKVPPVVLAELYSNLGEIYRRLGMRSEAEEYLNKSLGLKRKLLPKNHPHIAETQHYLARLYKDMGKQIEAQQMYEQCLEVTRNTLPDSHFEVAERRKELAQIGGRSIR